jgi:tRNA threonylcarbamoyladenosine dehydratase
MSVDFSRDVIFSRMIGIISPEEADLLAGKTIAVPGCGGVGYTHAEALVRMGVGGVHIADFDTFGPENFNRQFGATVHTVGLPKVDVLRDRLLSINPALRVEQFDGVFESTVDDFLSGVDVVCDALDYFVVEPRILMYAKARKAGIPVVMSGPIGFGAVHHYFAPDGMTFEDYFTLRPTMSEDEKLLSFGAGIDPVGLSKDYLRDSISDYFRTRTGPSVSSACLLATTLSTTSAFALLLGQEMFVKPVPYVYAIDYRAGRFEEVLVTRDGAS